MKRLAFVIVLAVIALNVAGRRHLLDRQARRPEGPPPVFAPTRWAGDGPQEPARKGIPKPGRRRPEPPKPTARPEPATAPEPAWFPKSRDEEEALARTGDARGVRVLVGPIEATPEKARRALEARLDAAVTEWLGGPIGPAPRLGTIVLETHVQPVAQSIGDDPKDLDDVYTLYRAGSRVDLSDGARRRLLADRERQVVHRRMIEGGGLLAFVLVALSALSGSLRVDPAVVGRRAIPLRLLALAGVGGAGALIYRALS